VMVPQYVATIRQYL